MASVVRHSGHRVAVASSAVTVASPRRTRRHRSSSLAVLSRRPRSSPSRTPSTLGSSWTEVTADRSTLTAATTALCRRLRRRLAYIGSLNATLRTYTASSLTDTGNSTPLKTYTHRSVGLLTHNIVILDTVIDRSSDVHHDITIYRILH